MRNGQQMIPRFFVPIKVLVLILLNGMKISLLKLAPFLCLPILCMCCMCGPCRCPELNVSTTDIRFNGTADYQKIAVTARHTDWAVEVLEGRDWITAGKANNMANVNVSENPNNTQRKGSIQISATEDAALYHIIYVTQEGGSTKLSVSPENVSFSASGGEQNIQVTCNTEWSVRGGNDWLTVEKLNQKTIALSAKKNETSEKLETPIIVYTTDGECAKLILVTIAAGL